MTVMLTIFKEEFCLWLLVWSISLVCTCIYLIVKCAKITEENKTERVPLWIFMFNAYILCNYIKY